MLPLILPKTLLHLFSGRLITPVWFLILPARSAQARLIDARNAEVSLEGRFDLAYNAAHAVCLAALRWHGYRPSNRYIVFQMLPHTLDLGAEVWRLLSKCHDMRNRGEYEGDLNADERLVADLITACERVAQKLDALKPIA